MQKIYLALKKFKKNNYINLKNNQKELNIDYFWLTFFTSIFILLYCNLIVQNRNTLINSLNIQLISLSLISIYFCIESLTKNKELGILIVITSIISNIFINPELILILILILSIFSLYILIKKSNLIDFINSIKTSLVSSIILITLYNLISPQPFTQYISVLNGVGSIDTLYHASLAAMIKNHQTISTGLHGLVYTPYHFLSHSIHAGISSISKIPIIESSEITKWLLLVPLLFYSICSFCEKLNNQCNQYKYWIITIIILVLFPTILNGWNFWNNYFNSDSYLLSLILLMIGVQRLLNKDLNRYDFFYIFLSLFLISLTKGSTGALYLVLILARICIIEVNIRFKLSLIISLTFLIIVSLVNFYINSIKTINIDYFDFIYQYGEINNFIFFELKNRINKTILHLTLNSIFFIMHFLVSIIVIILILKDKIYNKFYLTAVIISLLAGSISVIILKIPGGSVYYISNIAFFIAIPFLVLKISEIKYTITLNKLYIFLIILILFSIIKDIYEWSNFKKNLINEEKNRNFIFSLIDLRDKTSSNTIVIANKDYLKNNIKIFEDWKCIPYIYVAISERAWVNIFHSWNNCNYIDYSSSYYGVNVDNNTPLFKEIVSKKSLYYWPN